MYLRKPTVVRFPSYAFRGTPEEDLAALHRDFAERLASGRLSLQGLRWGPGERLLGWIEDVRVVGATRGPRWGRALLRRRSGQRPVDPNPPDPRSEPGSASAG